MPQTPNINYYDGANPAISKSYDVEFDDAIADTRFWKARSEGTRLQSKAINVFTQGDITYGKNPVIENKVTALYIGTTVIGGDQEDPSRSGIIGHSYITIDRILLINIETDEVQIIERQSLVDITTGVPGREIAFKRYITRDFPEGSEISIRLIDKTIQNSLKTSHHVKFNRGSLMKIYEYLPNIDGHEDGVFGGFGVRNNLESEYTGSLQGPGLFGYGMTAAASRSLFSNDSITFVGELPSELTQYSGDVNLLTMGSQLAPISASIGSSFTPTNNNISTLGSNANLYSNPITTFTPSSLS